MTLRSIVAASAMAAMGLVGAGSAANAITWTLTDVLLTDGGMLNGSFSTNVDGYINHAYSLTTTGGTLGSSLNTFYLGPNELVGPQFILGSNVVDFFSNVNGYQEELQLTFANPNTDPINSIIGIASFECFGWTCPSDVTRYVGSEILAGGDQLTATPLPTTWTTMLIALVGFGFIAYRRKSSNAGMAAI
jgi:hypothetical protein